MTPALAFIALSAPAMLAGLALLALPLIAHWLRRGARHRFVFPSLRLLAATQAEHARLHHPRRWLLLLLRALAVALLALAFARPYVRRSRAADAPPDRATALVLVADVSASMAQRSGGTPAMSVLRASAARTLRALVPGLDRAALVVASARADAPFPALTANLAAVAAEVEALEPAPVRADLGGALALAGRLLAAHDGPRRLVILSDRQRSNWADLAARGVALPPGVAVTFVPVAGAPPANAALSAPTVEPALPAAGEPVTLSVRVAHHGPGRARIPVTCRVGEAPPLEDAVVLDPGENREVAFAARFDEAGFHRVVFTIPDDGLPSDNRAYLAVPVVARAPVVVVGDDHPEEAGGASYFVVRALAPRGAEADPWRVRHLRGVDVTPDQLADAVGVVLAAPAALPDDGVAALAGYLRRGGGVWLFAGAPGMETLAARLAAAAPDAGLPFELGPVQAADPDRPWRIAPGDWRTRMLAPFDPLQRESVAAIPFRRRRAAGALDPVAQLLLAFDDGAPALAAREWPGGGRLVVAAFGAGHEAGDLVRHGFFVALLHRAVEDWRPGLRRRESLFAGQPLVFTTPRAFDPAGATPQLLGPDGHPAGEARVTVHRRDLTVRLDAAPATGFYDVVQDGRLLGRAAVNLDPRESDLERMDEAELLAALAETGAAGVRWHDAGADPERGLDGRGRPLWGWAVALAIGLLGVEMALLGRWRR